MGPTAVWTAQVGAVGHEGCSHAAVLCDPHTAGAVLSTYKQTTSTHTSHAAGQ